MDTFTFQGWRLQYDKEKTQAYYAAMEDMCNCAGCRNFYDNAAAIHPKVLTLLKQLGVRPERPIDLDYFHIGEQDKKMDYDVYYAVCGTVESEKALEIAIGPLRIVLSNTNLETGVACPNTDMSEPYFILAVFELVLPWTVADTSISQLYPERIFLGKRLKLWAKRIFNKIS